MSKKAQELAKLITEHPELDVVFMVDGNEVLFDHARTAHRIESIAIDYIMDYEDEYVIGEALILEKLEESRDISFIEIASAIREIPGRIKKSIIVETGAL